MQQTILAFIHSFGRHAKRRTDMQGWPPEMQKKIASRTANLACRPSYSTVLLFYYFTADTVLPRPMFGVGRPRCKKVFQVLPRTTAERSFCISDGQPRMSALLFYFFTNLLFYFFTPRPRCKKTFFHLGRPTLHVGPPILLFY